jgi:4-diphosphocytidyl-2-C-methyl-D-erythritol kinase
MTERAPAKINLCLFLGPTRAADGRHELVSVMQSLTLADELALGPAPAGAAADEVLCAGVEGPNLAGAALAAFRAATGWDAPPQRLDIAKRVPVAAGMGGGSGDAAAALRLAARASELGDEALLLELAAGLGADVPAQVRPGRALATGAGERVEPLADGGPLAVLVLPGARPLSTGAVYAEADRQGLARPPAELAERLAAVRKALAGSATAAYDRAGSGAPPAPDLPPDLMVNDLAPAALALAPEIADALAHARAAGADLAMVSGSGPTALGLFLGADGERRAHAAAAALAARRPAPLVAAAEPGWAPLELGA